MPSKLARIPHGTMSGYSWHGCRCKRCKRAWADYRRDRVREYRQRKARERKLEQARKLLRAAGEL